LEEKTCTGVRSGFRTASKNNRKRARSTKGCGRV
jgi:hypothetical protein